MLDLLHQSFWTQNLIPHGYCLSWNPSLLWTFVASDTTIAISYFSIPFAIWYFAKRRPDIPQRWLFLLFGVFIVACGITHLLDVLNIWSPNYWANAVARVFTAVASFGTAILLWHIMPQALKAPSAQQMADINQKLEASHTELELRIQSRTEALTIALAEKAVLADERKVVLDSPLVGLAKIKERKILWCNPAFEAMLGYGKDELIGVSSRQFYANQTEYEAVGAIAYPLLNSEKIYRSEIKFIRKDGECVWMELSGVMLDAAEQLSLWSFVDISDRKQAQEALQQSQRMLQLLLDSTAEAIYGIDLEGKCTFCNSACLRILGYADASDLIGKDMHELIHHTHTDGTHYPVKECRIYRAFQTGRGTHVDDEVLWRADRTSFPAEYWSFPQVVNGKVLGAAVTFIDITERDRLMENLARTRSGLRQIIDLVPDMLFVKDIEGRYLVVNSAVAKSYQMSTEELIGKLHSDIQPNKSEVAKMLEDDRKAIETGAPIFIPEETFLDASGKTRYLQTTKIPFNFAETDKPAILGLAVDITERKRAELKLQLAALVYQNSSEAMLVTDENNNIVAINQAFTELTGYNEEDALGKNPRFLSSGRHNAEFYKAMWASINSTGRWQGELWNRRKNGETYPEWLTIDTIYKEDGAVHRRAALFIDITEKKKTEEELLSHANYDQLTLLPNRRLFTDRLEQEIRKSHRDKCRTALLFIDLDHFKDVNDTLGHDVGDKLLIEAASRIKSCVRNYDTVARLGGDEFTVILSELEDTSDVGRIAQGIIGSLSQPFQLAGNESFISASIGITICPDDGTKASELIKHADQALYVAKNEGRSRLSFFTKAMQELSDARMQLGVDLRHAIYKGQLEVYYQPIVELSTGHTHKAEALLRWKHPVHGFVSPVDFIPVAEDTGSILDIGDWVFLQAVQQVKKLMDHCTDFQISVNKSPVQFNSDDQRHNHWIEKLNEMGLPGSSIAVEITEGLLINNNADINDKLLKLRDAGIQVSIDDFGTGYSSLSYLKKFDIDYLKIDQSFTRNLSPESEEFAICEAIVVMAHKLAIKVIAEGVETEQQRDLLKQIGCDYGQGYLFSRPVPAPEFEKWLLGS